MTRTASSRHVAARTRIAIHRTTCTNHHVTACLYSFSVLATPVLRQAITELNADRIGHGFHLYSSDLLSGIAVPAERGRFCDALSEYARTAIRIWLSCVGRPFDICKPLCMT